VLISFLRYPDEKRENMKIGNHAILEYCAALIVVLLMPFSLGNATSVREVSMDEMLRQSQLVFEGTVTAVEARETSQKRIHTYVTLQITDIIKGEYHGSSITLRFLGGTLGDVTMAVSDMRFPQQGEHGIYFVESLESLQANPFYGWSQGHFIVQRDATGSERVLTNRRLPVTGVRDQVHDEQTTPANERAQALSKGVSRDIVVGEGGKGSSGMTVGEFKKVLLERMGRRR
jgi:hypothetical protein